MPRRKAEIDGQEHFFPAADFETGAPLRLKPPSERLWTRNKAQLIAKYLREFVYVTRHGTYVDVFAGRQSDQVDASWSVEEVIDKQLDSFHLRHYWLFEKDPTKVAALEALRDAHPELDVVVNPPCDSNRAVPAALPVGQLGEKEATFCLIDQRTTECEWSTVRHLASMKPGRYKPELFYFLAQGWFNRALKSRTTDDALAATDRWWGNEQWRSLLELSAMERAEVMASRFREELGYKTAVPWPIYDREGGSTVMFHMIHATDHDRAPRLMNSAYEWAVKPKALPNENQLEMLLGDITYEP